MGFKVVEKKKLPALINELLKEYDVYTPAKRGNVLSFKRISSGNEVQLEFSNTKIPPKEIFLPQTETLFTYEESEDEIAINETLPTKTKKLLLGVRPCDARSFQMLENVFTSGEFEDVYYIRKRDNTIVLGFACNHPMKTCFCTSLGGSPFGKEGIDLLFQDINDVYLIEIITKEGAQLVAKLPLLKDAEIRYIEKAAKLAVDSETSIKSKIDVKAVYKQLDKNFSDQLWMKESRKCLGCGICTFLCPTCSCFDILEEEGETKKRVKIWDTCQFPCFTLHGSGHNPRPTETERLRQRIMHKFNYAKKNHNEYFCVGCGRCIRECPVNLDIREVLKAISLNEVD